MLVLSRKRDESIIIGDNIVITIVDIRGDKVRLGIQAPTEIPVHRQEVYEAIQAENARQSQSPLEKDVKGVSGGKIKNPQYFSISMSIDNTNNYDIIDMGRYGKYCEPLI